MRFHQFKPVPPLDRHVECFWYLETGSEPGPIQRIVPDGSVELILHAGTPFAQIRKGAPERQPTILFSGQITHPVFIAPQSHARVFGIRFFPAAAAALLQVPLSELTDQLLPLDSISPRLEVEVSRALDSPNSQATIAALTSILTTRLTAFELSSAVSHIVHHIHASGGNRSLPELAERCGLSSRQLQRLFASHVGVSPKTLCRIARFQRVLNLLDDGDRWADIAADAGYYDQSHLLLDFRQFAEETPSFLLSPDTDLAEHFVRRQPLSHFSKTAQA